MTNDDGRGVTTTFVDNVRATKVVTDTSDAFAFATQSYVFDSAGRITSRQTSFDDGREAQSTYQNGLLATRAINDVGDVYDWALREILYDTNGRVVSTKITFDDGTMETKVVPPGPSGQTVSRVDSADRFNWDSISTTYDALGRLAEETRVLDNGISRVVDFTDGLRTTATNTDVADVRDWSARTVSYGVDGQTTRTTRTMDDGREISTDFQNGIRATRGIVDTNDGFSWARQDLTFDAAGLVATKRIERDDGVIDTITYEDGVRQSRLRVDDADAHGWQSIETVYGANGALLFNARTNDDGSTRYTDVRGLDVIAGGTDGSITEDAAPNLETSGQIETVAGYRGSSIFVAQTAVAGSAGLGSFTLNADGSWSYSATNNQATIQALNAGESLTDSFTAATEDGVQTVVTVTLNGVDDGPAPVYVGGPLVQVGSVGNLASTTQSFDLATLFSDDMGDDLTISVANLPAGFSVVDGILTFGTGLALAGNHTIEVTATDSSGASVSQSVPIVLAMAHDYGDSFAAFGSETINATIGDDNFRFGREAAQDGSLRLLLSSGSDTVQFGESAAQSGSIVIDAGFGSEGDTISFGRRAASGGTIDIDLGDGENMLTFGGFAAGPELGSLNNGRIQVDGGTGSDTITFGTDAATDLGSIRISTFDGDDTITFGADAALENGTITVATGAGDDTITFGANAARSLGFVSIDAGDGADHITFGTGLGRALVDLGRAQTPPFGNDGDADVLIFEGTLSDVTVQRFDIGIDTIAFTGQPADAYWTAVDQGLDKLFTSNDGQSFTITGAAGLDPSTLVSGLTYNTAPTYVGGALVEVGSVGSLGPAGNRTFDLSAIFSDDIGDALTITQGSSFPGGMAVVDGFLIFNNTLSFAGTRSIEITATDSSGASITQSVPIVIALAHDYGDVFSLDVDREIQDSLSDDTLLFGNAAAFNALLDIDLSGGSDTVRFGDTTAFQGDLVVSGVVGREGADISFADNAALGTNGSIEIELSGSDDTISFADRAAGDGDIDIELFGGENRVTFGNFAAAVGPGGEQGGTIDVEAFADGADHVSFGDNAASGLGRINVLTSDGDDTILIGDNGAQGGGLIGLTGADGADTITVGDNAGQNGGRLIVNGGTGADQITIGTGVENAQVLLGSGVSPADGDADQLTFKGTVKDVIVNGFEIGTDTITFTGQPAGNGWVAVDQGPDKRFTSSDGQSFTITGAAGVDPTTLVTGLTFNSAPVYDDKGFPIADYPYYVELAGHVGNQTTAPPSFDLRSMFFDEAPENLTITVEPFFPVTLPSSIDITDGVLTAVNPLSAEAGGLFVVNVTATDDAGWSTTQFLAIDLGLKHDFGDDYVGPNFCSFSASDVTYGDNAFAGDLGARIDLGFSDHIFAFGDGTARNGSLEMTVDGGSLDVDFGDYTGEFGLIDMLIGPLDDAPVDVKFGDYVGKSGTVTVTAGNLASDNQITAGDFAGADGGLFSVASSSGNNTVKIGEFAGLNGGRVTVVTGAGKDTITVGDNSEGRITIDAGGGNNMIRIGGWDITDGPGTFRSARVEITAGGGDNTIIFEGSTLLGGVRGQRDTNIFLGDGDDTLIFEDATLDETSINYRFHQINTGAGNDIVTFGANAGEARIIVGDGIDVITFKPGSFTATTVILGYDTDVDIVNFSIDLERIEISGFEAGYDTINLPQLEGEFWTLVRVFPAGAEFIHELTSNKGRKIDLWSNEVLTVREIIANAETPVAPELVSDDTDFGVIEVGNMAAAFSLDVKALFTDENVVDGFEPDFTVSMAPNGFLSFDGTTLTFINQNDVSLGGDYAITFTATDTFGLSLTQEFTFAVAVNHDFGDFAPIFYLRDTVSGSSEDDVLVVGTVNAASGEGEGGEFFMDGGAGDDVMNIGAITMNGDYSVLDVTGGAGDDQITIASLAVGGFDATAAVSGGTGADVITFSGHTEQVTLDFGSDSDADRFVFLATTTDVSIANWDQGTDLVDVLDHTVWSVLSDDGTNTVLSDGTSSLTFLNITGLTHVDDFLI